MPITTELVGKVGRLDGQHPPTQHGLTLAFSVPQERGQGIQRVTACAITADTLALATHQGTVYAVHPTRKRYVCLDRLPATCTAAAFMTRMSRRLFVGCSDGAIHCYDVSNSSHLAQLPGHRTAVTSLSTKPDTEQLLSASADAVLLWDMMTFRQRRMLGSAPYGSSVAAFSPAGNLCAAATPAGVITLWDAKSLRELAQLRTPAGQQQKHFAISSMCFSPDEQWLLVSCKAPALLLCYSLQARALQLALLLPADNYGILQALMMPDSTSAAVLTSIGSISFVDLQSGCITGQLHLTFPGCRALSISTDARANTMAVVCSDGLLRLYDLGVVRAKQQQGQRQNMQLQQLTAEQLLDIPAIGEEVLFSADLQLAGTRQQNTQRHQRAAVQPNKILSNVNNVKHGTTATGKAKGPSAGSRKPVQAASGHLSVRQLSGPAAALNRRKLQDMLLAYGEFPARYRRLIWEQLLQLPHNSAAFALLQDKGVHPALKDLLQPQAPGGTRSSVAVRLQASLSQLARWCPLFGEVGFLPDLAFPFVKVFGPNAESAFEAVATLLLNWCKGWFELFPNPPLSLLQRFLLLLSHHDLELGGHLQQLGVPALEAVWCHMSCALSDLLPDADDWLVLWDHILAASAGPCFFYSVLCSYLISQRQHLLAALDEHELAHVFAARPPVDVRKVIKLAHQLHERTPGYAQLGASSLTPMPPAEGYPVFSEYPNGSVELQQLERQRIQEAEDALVRRRQVVAELQQRSKQVAFEAAALTSQRQQLAALDAQRRAALRAIEDSLASAGARLDDCAKEEKLKQIRLAEEAYQASLASLRSEWSAELAALKADVEHKRRLAAAALKARQEEEDIKALEFQAEQRLWALQQEELAAAGSSALRDAASAQASALASQLQRKAAEWQVQDEARNLKQQHEHARKARLAAAAEQEAALQAAKGLLLAQELQTQEELAKLEHQRQMRQLAEDEAELTAQQLQLQAEKQAVAAAAGRQAMQEQAQAKTERFSRLQQERGAAVTAAYDVLHQQLSELHLAAAELGSTARLSEAQQQLVQMEQTLSQADQEHAARVAGILRKLQLQQQGMEPLRASGGPTAAAPDTVPADSGGSTAAASSSGDGAVAAVAAAAVQPTQQLESSLEAVEQRLVAIRRRRAGLESLYGAQLDAEVQRLVAVGQAQQRSQQQHSPTASAGAAEGLAVALDHSSPSVPTSEASAGSGSSGDSGKVSQGVSGSSVDVSAELEHLLAEAEAEVQRELAVARGHLRGSQLYPYSSARTPPLQQQYHSLQSSVGRGRGRSSNGSVAQGSHTVSTGVAARAAQPAAPPPAPAPRAAAAAAASLSGRLKPVQEEPAPADKRPTAGTHAAAAPESGPKPADSSSSSSSSPDKKVEGGDGKVAKADAGVSGTGTLAAAAAVVDQPSSSRGAASGPTQGAAPTGSGSSHGSTPGHQGATGQRTAPTPPTAAAAAAGTPALPDPQLNSPGSVLTVRSSAGGAVGSGSRQGPPASAATAGGTSQGLVRQAGSSGGSYRPVLVGADGARQASADTERVVAALSAGPVSSPSISGGDTSSSSVSKPSSLTFGVHAGATGTTAAAPSITPMLGTRTQRRTRSNQAADSPAPEAPAQSGSSSSLRASLRSVGSQSWGGGASTGSELDDAVGPAALSTSAQLQARFLEPTGRVSSELRQSSSATSEELEQLLQQLSVYEEHLLEEVAAAGGASEPTANAPHRQQQAVQPAGRGEVGASVDSSLSWSRTLAGLSHLLPANDSS